MSVLVRQDDNELCRSTQSTISSYMQICARSTMLGTTKPTGSTSLNAPGRGHARVGFVVVERSCGTYRRPGCTYVQRLCIQCASSDIEVARTICCLWPSVCPHDADPARIVVLENTCRRIQSRRPKLSAVGAVYCNRGNALCLPSSDVSFLDVDDMFFRCCQHQNASSSTLRQNHRLD